jgi:uncharacterized protein YndB with AHSA1/START domain
MEAQPVTVEVVLDAPIERVWKAITDKNDMKQWYFDLVDFKAEPGFEFQFEGGPDPKEPYVHLCKVVESIPNKKLSYSWKYAGYPGNSLVTFELSEEGTKTKLRLTHTGLETFPADNKDFARENFVGGWNQLIGVSIKDYLGKENT